MATKKHIFYLKYILPALSIGLIASAVFYSAYKSSAHPLIKNINLINSSENIRYNGSDTKGRPFVVTSSKGQEISETEILLNKPEVVLDLNKDTKIKLRADQGVYNKTSKTLTISGGVHLTHSNGLNLLTSEALIDLEKGTAQNNKPVEGYNERATIKAESFKVSEQGENILFQGKPELVIRSKAKS